MADDFGKEKRLTDSQMQFYIKNGYIQLNSSFNRGFHFKMKQKMDEITRAKVGNNITNVLPDLTAIWNHDPVIKGALVSLLGENYDCHGHRHLHLSPPGKKDQVIHMDSHWGFNLSRPSRHRRLMLMYYPHYVKDDMGPTSICPGTQFFHSAKGDYRHVDSIPDCWEGAEEKRLTVPAGTICLIDYNLWHRGTGNISNKNRWMLKMLFVRNEEPIKPTWDHKSKEWPDSDTLDPIRKYMWLDTWRWYLAEKSELPPSGVPLDELQAMLFNNDATVGAETNRLMASSHLGALNEVDILLASLSKGKTICRSTQHGLAIAVANGECEKVVTRLKSLHKRAVDKRVQRITSKNSKRSRFSTLCPNDVESCQRSALCLALGEASHSKDVFDCLVTILLKDPCPCARRDAAEALRHFVSKDSSLRSQTLAVKAMCITLFDDESVIRMLSARALRSFQIRGFDLSKLLPQIQKQQGLEKNNRYVLEVLHRIFNSEESCDKLDQYFCPMTTKKSEF